MISIRIREYGSSADWTEGRVLGELEESVADALLSALEGKELHIQARRDGGEWQELAEWEGIEDA